MAARCEPSNFSHTNLASSVNSRTTNQQTKDPLQRSDIIKTEFHSREGLYKISSLIDNLGKIGTNTCLNEPVKITLMTRLQTLTDSQTSSRRSSTTNNDNANQDYSNERKRSSTSNDNPTHEHLLTTDILAFNVGRELILYEFAEATQPSFGEPIDHRIYKQNHQPTCHDITQDPDTNSLHILVGFSKGQIQYINMHTKEQKVFNEGSYLDKTKVTCIKWLPSPKTCFAVSYSSGYLFIFDEQLNHQRDTNIQLNYTTIKDDDKNYSISYLKNKTKQARNPLARWSIGSGSLNEFAFSPDHTYLATVSQDGFLRIFHYEKMELMSYMKSYFGGLLCVCWSPDGKYLATGGEDDFLTLFSFNLTEQTPRVLCRGHGHTSWISAISFDAYMNAKTYYSSLIQRPSSYSLATKTDENFDEQFNKSNRNFETTIPTLFYRIGSVGQDNRLCFWDITEDILRIHENQSNSLKKFSSVHSSVTSNGHSSFLSDTTPITSANSLTVTTKSSFTSLASRLSFARNSNKIPKPTDDSSETLSNGSSRKSRKLPSLSQTLNNSKSPSSSIDTSQNSLVNSSTTSRRTNLDLTKSVFGTTLCPRLHDIQLIEPIVTEFISHERLNGIYFGENYFLTSSQDGIITIWEKPSQILSTNSIDDRTTLINSNSHHSIISQRL